MTSPDTVVIGASAGGLQAVMTVVRSLPADFPAAVFVVIHRGPDGPALLPELLGKESRLPIRVPTKSEKIRPGHLYLAPLDCHIVLHDSRVNASHGPRENGFRPAVDPLFCSAAAARGECVVGIVLSGALDDGTAGLLAIKRKGGIAIVQHPEEARVPSMPLSALKTVEVDAVLTAAQIGPHLLKLVGAGADDTRPAETSGQRRPPGEAAMGERIRPDPEPDRHLSGLTCPDCGGALWAIEDGAFDLYECLVGHRYSIEALRALSDDRTENALWSAARALKEDAALRRRMAARATGRGLTAIAQCWLDDARASDAHAARIREVVEALNGSRGEEEQIDLAAIPPHPAARRSGRKPSVPGSVRRNSKAANGGSRPKRGNR